jgi:beta-N-acetylhexosaminidase
MEALLETENEKCQLLRSLGINVNLGPVCDISTQPGALLYQRSLGQSPEITSDCIAGIVKTMAQNRVGSVLKHFPGYGDNADTHVQIATDSRTLKELENRDLIPFRAAMDAGADAVMVCHIITEAFDPETPASLSPVVHQYLRQEMGYDGVIITDDLVMEAIRQQYGAGEAAVLAVLAGNDLLCSTEYALQYEAVLEAVMSGRIDYYTLTDAVRRILRWKQELGLI